MVRMLDPRHGIAHHEAGHVVAGLRLGLDLLDADILPDDEGGRGHTNFADPGPWFSPRRGSLTPAERDFVERVLTTFMAGFAAESHWGHVDLEGSGYDRDKSMREWARYLEDPSLDRFLGRAREIVTEPSAWSAIERVAAALLEHQRLDGEALKRLVEPGR